jgi:tripartite-type tricarboxylate transporter receptor subunit TctC
MPYDPRDLELVSIAATQPSVLVVRPRSASTAPTSWSR